MNALGIIGTGNMAEALVAGSLKAGLLKPKQVCGFDIDSKKLKSFSKKHKLNAASSLGELVRTSERILIAIKPQQAPELLEVLKPLLKNHHLILSILAGRDTLFFKKHLGKNVRCIRAMPNTPALVGAGATAFFATSSCKKTDVVWTKRFFDSVGISHEVKLENLLDAVTALSGSGPAYVFLFLQSLIEAGIHLGLPPTLASQLAWQTLQGSTLLAQSSLDSLPERIAQVTSKGGTTEAALQILHQRQFPKTLRLALLAAAKRAAVLKKA